MESDTVYVDIPDNKYRDLLVQWLKDKNIECLTHSSEFDHSIGLCFVSCRGKWTHGTNAYQFKINNKKKWLLAKIKYGI